jgi:SDR family mycofactocin-dependent oxidoreductase
MEDGRHIEGACVRGERDTMSGNLKGRIALVTGGARGVGREVALGLAEAGADVALIDRCVTPATTPYAAATRDDLEDSQLAIESMGRRCLAVQADVTDLPAMAVAVEGAVQQLGRLDIVVANAGIFTWGRLWELTEQQWDETIAVNLKGTWITLKVTVPYLIAQSWGRVVCVSSTAGLRGGPNIAHYVASKHGVIGLVRSLAMEVGEFGVTVNAVCPSRMKTKMVTYAEYYEAFAGPGATEADLDRVTRREQVLPIEAVPATAVREAVVWLASDAAQHITGLAVPIDAGEMLI